MKVLGSTENKIIKDRNGENLPHLVINKVVLVYCNIINNNYRHDSRALYTFAPNKTFVTLLEISPRTNTFLQIFISKFRSIRVWFTDLFYSTITDKFNFNN